jgi:hypothetical protein
MSRANQIQTLYDWTPSSRLVFKRSIPEHSKIFKVPQTVGTSGWIIFTYENDIPVCFWMNAHETRKVQCIVDERLFGDTFLRAEKLGNFEYVISDIFIYNSNCVYACSTFEQRYNWLKQLMSTFMNYVPGTAKFIHKSDLSPKIKLKGYEAHTDEPGKPGYFLENDTSNTFQVVKLPLPDCYEVESGGYLRVPDLKTSEFLRSKGQSFKCACTKNSDGSWTLTENIP